MAVYLLHLSHPLTAQSGKGVKYSQHYLGWTDDLDRRIQEHRTGHHRVSARLMEVAHERNIGFVVARVWEDGDRWLERLLKSHKRHRDFCPVCQAATEGGRRAQPRLPGLDDAP
jgi:hypothetical protein